MGSIERVSVLPRSFRHLLTPVSLPTHLLLCCNFALPMLQHEPQTSARVDLKKGRQNFELVLKIHPREKILDAPLSARKIIIKLKLFRATPLRLFFDLEIKNVFPADRGVSTIFSRGRIFKTSSKFCRPFF